MKRVLVTGGCGFIGSHFVESILEDHKVFVIDDFSTGRRDNLPRHKNLEAYEENIAEFGATEKLIRDFAPDAIVHLAAIASVQQCQQDPDYTHRVNYQASKFLVDLALEMKLEKFIFASSAALYGDDPELPKSVETSKLSPISQYGHDKLASEKYLMQNFSSATAFRFFNVYGPRQNPSSPYSGVLSIFKNKVDLSEKPELIIYGDGEQTRDFIYVTDVARALKIALESSTLEGSVFNVARGIEYSLNKIIGQIQKITGKEIKCQYQAARDGDIKRSYADISPLLQKGLRPEVSLEQGLSLYFNEAGQRT